MFFEAVVENFSTSISSLLGQSDTNSLLLEDIADPFPVVSVPFGNLLIGVRKSWTCISMSWSGVENWHTEGNLPVS